MLLIGLGALGSSIGISLARAGVGKIGLVDHDVVEPGPLVRQTYDRRDIGLPKVLAMKRRLKDVNPHVEVTMTFLDRLGSAPTSVARATAGEDQLAEFSAQVEGFDLIISVPGLNSVDFVVNELGAALGIPRIFAWVTNGAWGGRVFRAKSDAACFECLSQHVDLPQPSSDPDLTPIYARGCGFPTFSGTGFDAESLANAASRFAVQTLLSGILDNRSTVSGEFPAISHHQVDRHPKCFVCGRYP